jgi:hypothetical protein
MLYHEVDGTVYDKDSHVSSAEFLAYVATLREVTALEKSR